MWAAVARAAADHRRIVDAGDDVFYDDLSLRRTGEARAGQELMQAVKRALDVGVAEEELVDALMSGDPSCDFTEALDLLQAPSRRDDPMQWLTEGLDNHGGSVYLRVHGKGHKIRSVPLYTDITAALEQWRDARERISELAGDPLLFPRLGRGRRDGSFPDARGQLSTTAVIKIVRPIMLAAGIPAPQAHPHPLRHTFGRLYMAAPGAELSRLQKIMGHASPETTSRYVHHADAELASEHRRIERLQHNPLSRRQQHQRDRRERRAT